MLKLILAGVLAIPCLLVCVVTAPILAILSIPPLLLLTFQKEGDDKFETNRKKNNSNSSDKNIPDHAIIFGGSTGIGFCVAQECIRKNVPRITILARNQDKLDKAKEELEQQIKAASTPTTTVVRVVSVNVSDFPALQKVAKDICPNPHTEKVVLYNCAGISYTLDMEKVQIETYMKLIQTNQLGAMYVLRAFIPVIYHGTIVLTSSAAGQVGLYGYTAYSPTKYALRGLAETVHQELVRTRPDVNIQVAFPTDTATPGYEEESKIMPELTKIINEAGGLSDPKDVAKIMVNNSFSKNPSFLSYFSFDGWMLSNLTAGMAPVSSLGNAITQVAAMNLLRFISLFYLNDWWRVIRSYDKKKNEKKGD